MTTVTFNPAAAFQNMMPMSMPFFDTWFRIAELYRETMQASVQQLMLSSASIVQQHASRAFMTAWQASAQDLAQNAMNVQRQTLENIAASNQKAMSMMGNAFTQAWTSNAASR